METVIDIFCHWLPTRFLHAAEHLPCMLERAAGVFDRWPNLKIIAPHGGGLIPMLAGNYKGLV